MGQQTISIPPTPYRKISIFEEEWSVLNSVTKIEIVCLLKTMLLINYFLLRKIIISTTIFTTVRTKVIFS